MLHEFRLLALVLLVALVALPNAAAGQGEPTAKDGARLRDQSAATQAMFQADWASQAAREWVTEHNAAIGSQAGGGAAPGGAGRPATPGTATAPGVHQRPQAPPPPPPDAPPIPAGTTQVPITTIADPAAPDMPIGADLMDIDQAAHRLYVGNHNSDGVDVFDVARVDRFLFAAQAFHRGPVIGFFDGTGHFITNVPTNGLSHQVALDQTNMMVYTVVGPLGIFRLP